jgi:hypothetical protein
VFQDGDEIITPDGLPPENLAEIRSGERTADSKPIAGVVLELRDGFTGLPITADSGLALPGYYSGGTITVTTDANGHYRFEGLKSGFYSVFQIHPEGYVDGIDTVGTTSGLAINPGVTGIEISTLAVDPQNDAIIRIRVTPGVESRENNFSEVVVKQEIPPRPPFDKGGRGGICLRTPHRNPPIPPLRKGVKVTTA